MAFSSTFAVFLDFYKGFETTKHTSTSKIVFLLMTCLTMVVLRGRIWKLKVRVFVLMLIWKQLTLKRTPVKVEWCSEIPVATLVESHCSPPFLSRRQCASTVMLTPSAIPFTVCCSRAFFVICSHPHGSTVCPVAFSTVLYSRYFAVTFCLIPVVCVKLILHTCTVCEFVSSRMTVRNW